MCPRSCGPFYIVTYYIKWVTHSIKNIDKRFMKDLPKLQTDRPTDEKNYGNKFDVSNKA